MIKRFTLLVVLAVASTLTLWAETKQTVTIDGAEQGKFVTLLTFEDNKVVLAFDDNTTQTAEMELVSIALTYDGTATAIRSIQDESGTGDAVYTLSGQYAGQSAAGLKPGLYIIKGKKVIVK
jgi:hypothetical protein